MAELKIILPAVRGRRMSISEHAGGYNSPIGRLYQSVNARFPRQVTAMRCYFLAA